MSANPFSEVDKSEIVFGYIDHTRFYGELEWHSVTSEEFWAIPLDDILHNGKSLGLFKGRKY